MKMKKAVIFVMIFGLATMCAFGQKKETRLVSDFTGIYAVGGFDIKVEKGEAESLTIETSDEIMPYVRNEIKAGFLHLYISSDAPKKIRNNYKNIKIFIIMKDFEDVYASGSCTITATDLFTPKNFVTTFNGACVMNINVNTDMFMITASGACKIDLTGSANELNINTSGTSVFNTGNFTVKTASINSSGSSDVTINATNTLQVNSSHTANIKYKGRPITTINSSGTTRVKNIE
jgi:hypothetical protein